LGRAFFSAFYNFIKMDLTNDIPDFVMDSFVRPTEQNVPRNAETFESKWAELGSILKETWARQDVYSFTQIRLSDIIDALTHPVPDDQHLWTSPVLAPFIRLTSWDHVRGETGFYELAATLSSPTLIFAFECSHAIPRTYSYGPHELVSIPRVVTAHTFVFLLQRISHPNISFSSTTHGSMKKKRLGTTDVSPVTTTDPAEQDLVASMTVTTSNMTEPFAETILPVTERQRMGPIGSSTNSMSSATATTTEFTFDLHEIMMKWKSENKRPTVEKICETEHIAQRDVKRWLESKGLTWTKMLIQYGFRETKN
jgi:hypothetical protein